MLDVMSSDIPGRDLMLDSGIRAHASHLSSRELLHKPNSSPRKARSNTIAPTISPTKGPAAAIAEE